MTRTPSSPAARSYFLGLDLGQAQDFSALVVLESADPEPPRIYAGRHLQRWPLGTSYPDITRAVARLAAHIVTQTGSEPIWLALDATGVGRPVVDLLKRQPMPQVQMKPIIVTGGDVVGQEAGFWHVPKRDLIACVQVCLQTARLKIANALPEADTLTKELQTFQMKISLTTGHDSYGAWREGTHDDLVLALACALWCGERRWPRWVPIDDGSHWFPNNPFAADLSQNGETDDMDWGWRAI